MTSRSTIHSTICVFVLSLKVLIAQTRLKAILRDINKVLSIETTLQKLKLI